MLFVSVSKLVRSLSGGLILLLLLSGETRAQELPDFTEALKVAKAAAPLNDEERALAVRLAEETLRANKLLPDKKTFLTLSQAHRNTEEEKKGIFERNALLTYYRNAGDLGILVYINLAQRTTKMERLPHFPAPVAREELQRARELALNQPELKKVLKPYAGRLIVETLLTSNPLPKDPLFGHRLLYLLFRVGPRYLTAQGEVLVDLTTEKVIIHPTSQEEREGPKH